MAWNTQISNRKPYGRNTPTNIGSITIVPHADRPPPPPELRCKMAMTLDSNSYTSSSAAVDSINTSLSSLSSASDDVYTADAPRRFSDFARRLRLALSHLLRPTTADSSFPASVQTALKGIAADLSAAADTASFYRDRSRILVLANCVPLCAAIQDRSLSISRWLCLLDSAVSDSPESRKKISDLASDMKQADFRVTENEARVYCTLRKEGEGTQLKTSKAVQSAIVMDLARALGVDPENHAFLSDQIKLLRDDVANSRSAAERRMLSSLERVMGDWAAEPKVAAWKLDIEFDDDSHISPFRNFLCPLTKEVMREPVVLESSSSQTYERAAIEYWFERCLEDGRDPTCPVTGQAPTSLELKPNIGLAGAIEEWLSRNVEIQARIAAQRLEEEPPADAEKVEKVLDNVYKISVEYPWSRYQFRCAGIVGMVARLLRNSSKRVGTNLRSTCLRVLHSMAKDEESKKIMLEDGAIKLGIHSLIASSERERENALKLLLEFSSDEACCTRIASEKGALVLLSSVAGNLEHLSLSNLAEEVLRRIEMVETNVFNLAAAGRFEPLLVRLREGSDDTKVEMASLIGNMALTNNGKEQLARQSAKTLVELLAKPAAHEPSLLALYNFSTLDDNATILVDSNVLPSLTDILFGNQDASSKSKELAAQTIANIVSNPGHWELASADKEGHSMQSESVVYSLLVLLSDSSSRCQACILHILCGIASSPQASESVISHIKSGGGIDAVLPFLDHPEAENRIYAFKLTRLLSERFGQDLAHELRASNKLTTFRDKLLNNQYNESERSDTACILANVTLNEDEVKTLLGTDFVKWAVNTLGTQRRNSKGRVTGSASRMQEGLLGILLHLTNGIDPPSLQRVRENRLMAIFREQLCHASRPRAKRLAALGLKNLSECGRLVAARESEPQPPQGLCSFMVLVCGTAPSEPSSCPIHSAPCDEADQRCLLRADCVRPLVELLAEGDAGAEIAALEALATLVDFPPSSSKRAAEELEELGAIDAVVDLFVQSRPGEVQERAVWIIERVLRVESQNHRLSLNQALVRALVEAFRHGNAGAKRHAQDALTNLKQLSGVSGKPSSQFRSRR